MLRALLCVTALVATVVLPGAAQQGATPNPCAAAPARPAFDVISIRPSAPDGRFSFDHTADGITTTSPLRQIIQYAYNLRDFQLMGGPDWISSAAWKIEAKSDTPSIRANDAQGQELWNKEMEELQSMLADRYHFSCHMETKEMPVYNLVLAKGGSKLKRTTADKKGSTRLSGHAGIFHASGSGVGTDRIAILLASGMDRLVLDKTGLSDIYDFTLDWANDTPAGSQPAADAGANPSIFTAVEEQLGLRLEPAKGPVPVLVIDHVERPSAN